SLWGYDALVPNKTIYVSDGDLPTYQRAQELAGGNLSAAIASALKRYVDIEERRSEGYEEVVVRVGLGNGRKVRFTAALPVMHAATARGRESVYNVYRGRTGKYVLHIQREATWWMVDAEGKPAGWRGYLGVGDIKSGSAPKETTTRVSRSR